MSFTIPGYGEEAHGARLTAEWSPGRQPSRNSGEFEGHRVAQLEERGAHNPEVAGSNPAPVTNLATAVACAAVPSPCRCGRHRGDARLDWQRVPGALRRTE